MVQGLKEDLDKKLTQIEKYKEVLDYCMHDCILTYNVFSDAPHQSFEAVGYNGQRSKKHQLKVNW